jgi:hypothetical protein
MKQSTVLLIIASIFLGGMIGIYVQSGITETFLETKNQKENTKAMPLPVKESTLSIPTTMQQAQSVDKMTTNQTQSLGNKMSQQGAASEGVPPGYSSELIEVKFREGTDVDPPEVALPPDLRDAVASILRGFSLSAEQLRRRGADRLQLWFRINLKPGVDPVDFMERLKQLTSVESAQFVPKPALPPR